MHGYIAESVEIAQTSALSRSDNFFIKAKMRYFFSHYQYFHCKGLKTNTTQQIRSIHRIYMYKQETEI